MAEHIPFPHTPYAGADAHRRIAGNLSVPRTLQGLTGFIRTTDPFVPEAVSVEQVITTLVEEGFVERLGEFENPADVLEAMKANERTPHLHRDEAKAYKSRIGEGRGSRYLGIDGTLFVLTQKGYDALTGPIADEPEPMTDNRLEWAKEFNRRLAEQDAEAAK